MDMLLLRRPPSPFVYQPLEFRWLDQDSLPNLHSLDLPLPDVLPYRPMTQTNRIRSLADTNQKLLHMKFPSPFCIFLLDQRVLVRIR
jgi:hypothetical protein